MDADTLGHECFERLTEADARTYLAHVKKHGARAEGL